MRFWKRSENPHLVRIEQVLGELGSRLAAQSDADARRIDDIGREIRELGGVIQQQGQTSASIERTLGQALQTFFSHRDEVLAATQRLSSEFAQGFDSVADRVGGGLHELSASVEQAKLDVASRLISIERGLDSSKATLQANIDGDRFVTLLERMDQVLALAQRLDSDVVQGFAAVVQRLETDLVQLANTVHRMDGDVASAVNAIHSNATLHQLTELTQLSQRLDADVVRGFAAVVQRLETDLVQLANAVQLLGNAVHRTDITVSEHSGVIAKFVIDQNAITTTRRLRAPESFARPYHSTETAKASPPSRNSPWVPLDEASVSPELRKEIQPTADERIWVLEAGALSFDATGFIDVLRAARSVSRTGDRFAWMQPLEGGSALDIEETRQVLGVLGPVDFVRDIGNGVKRYRLAVGKSRSEGLGLVLRWSLPALEALHLRLGPVVEEAIERFRLHGVLHAIDLPEPDASHGYWKEHIGRIARLIAKEPRAASGVVLPRGFTNAADLYDAAFADVEGALREAGAAPPSFQWVRGAVPVAISADILAFARRHGLRFDFTPVCRGTGISALEAYDETVPYQPMSFDIRIPNFKSDAEGPLAFARLPGRIIAKDAISSRSLPSLIDEDFEQSCARLFPILDRGTQKQYELQVNLDTTLYSFWPQYFVFNWASPRGGSMRLVEFDAGDLMAPHSPLAFLASENRLGTDDPHWKNGADFLALGESLAADSFRLSEQPNKIQIEEHHYQRERPDITADAERLITWMPEKLGVTLELGCGLGVMARRIAHRAERYVGLDLTIGHAEGVAAAGAQGLVADIHFLPFEDDSVDTLIADNVVEHALDPVRVLSECRRVLRSGANAFLIIPYDFATSRFANRSHFWKADEASIRSALRAAGLEIHREEMVRMAELGIPGAYPSCEGQSGLWMVGKPRRTGAQRHKGK